MAAVVHSCGSFAVEIVCKFCKPLGNEVSISNKKNDKHCEEPYFTLDNGVTIHGLLTTIKAIVRFADKHHAVESGLLGKDPLEQAEVEQLLEYCRTQISPSLNETAEIKEIMKSLNSYMEDRVYLVGHCITLADLLFFSTFCDTYHTLTFQEKEKYIHLSRWFCQIQNQPSVADLPKKVRFLRNLVYY